MSTKKLKIAVIGSTGSVGKNTLEIIKENHHYFKIDLLVCNSNTKLIIEQLKFFLPKYVFINNLQTYEFVRKIKYKKNYIY
jgi:1-deoxy-D-xylulose 5-phosphate reductoisomerase